MESGIVNRTEEYDRAFAPFGEVYDRFDLLSSGVDFTGDTQDISTVLFDTPNRELHPNQGRWLSPDPSGLQAADPTTPQSWNRYAYVLNNPLLSTDPTGLWCVWEDGTHDPDPVSGESDSGATTEACAAGHGHWDPHDTITGILTDNDGNVTQINTVFDSVNGGPCTSANCGAGMTLEDFDQTLQTYTRGDAPAQDVPIYGFGMGQDIFLSVGRLTNPFTKQVNCVAAAAYPFIPGPKPEDVEDPSGLGTDAGEKAAESAAGSAESAAAQIKNAGRIGPSRAARIAKLEGRAKGLSAAGKALSVAGYALATKEAVNNFRNCEGQR